MYDLILRDATIVSSTGRLVADVAVKDGRIAYVGPRPPRRTKAELSAIGKFLMPGFIDVGGLLVDDYDAATWETESAAAVSGGTTTLLSLPPIGLEGDIEARRAAIEGHSWCNYGFWGAAPRGADLVTVRADLEAGRIHAILAEVGGQNGHTPAEILATADLPGILGVRFHGDPNELKLNSDGNPADCPAAMAVVELARDRNHPVHWSHLSTNVELDLLDPVRGDTPVTSSVSVHHLFLSVEDSPDLNLSPPLRSEQDRRTLWTAVKRGRLDCVASDHRTVQPGELGAPSAELTLPMLLSAVRQGRMSLEQLAAVCAENPARVFGLANKGRIAKGADADLLLFSEDEVSRVNLDRLGSTAEWSPYADRESSPKPDFVMVGGKTMAARGRLVGDAPVGVRLSAAQQD